MTGANHKEAHPINDENPNLIAHQNKRLGQFFYKNLPARHDDFNKRFFENKHNIRTNTLGQVIFDIPEEIVPRVKKKKNKKRH